MMNIVSFLVLAYTSLHNDGRKDGKRRERRKEEEKSPFFENLSHRRVKSTPIEQMGMGSLYVTFL